MFSILLTIKSRIYAPCPPKTYITNKIKKIIILWTFIGISYPLDVHEHNRNKSGSMYFEDWLTCLFNIKTRSMFHLVGMSSSLRHEHLAENKKEKALSPTPYHSLIKFN